MSIVMAKQKKSLSRVDIFKEEIDQIFIKSGLKPSVWEYKNGYICYLPKRRTIIRSDQTAVPFQFLTRVKVLIGEPVESTLTKTTC